MAPAFHWGRCLVSQNVTRCPWEGLRSPSHRTAHTQAGTLTALEQDGEVVSGVGSDGKMRSFLGRGLGTAYTFVISCLLPHFPSQRYLLMTGQQINPQTAAPRG